MSCLEKKNVFIRPGIRRNIKNAKRAGMAKTG